MQNNEEGEAKPPPRNRGPRSRNRKKQEAAPAVAAPPAPTAPEAPKKVVDRPPAKIANQIPTPKNLSTKSTELTNDPLWKEGLILDGEVGLVNSRPIVEFAPDSAGFESLLEEEYRAISDVDKAFVKAIPQSVFNHYGHTLLWHRLALQAVRNGTSSRAQEQLVNVVNSHNVDVPAGIGAYLSGLGDFEDVTGVKHRLASAEPNDHGHFGRATAKTHGLYETLPAPAVSLQRVLDDLMYTEDRDRDPVWDIEAIRPQMAAGDEAPAEQWNDEDDADLVVEELHDEDVAAAPAPARQGAPPRRQNRPTVNLLGWRPARILDKNQLSELRNIFEEVPAHFTGIRRTIPRYGYCPELFELALRRVKEIKGYQVVPLPTNAGGSIAQQLVWDPDPSALSYLERQATHQGAISSHTTIHSRVATIAKVLCFRALRRESGPTAPWACYGFNNYQDVPQNWRANRNTLIVNGLRTLVEVRPFSGVICNRRDALIE